MDAALIDEAVRRLRAGEPIGMPTETVYGLAADARDAASVARVFSLKGRPSTNPLIVHVASIDLAGRYAVIDDRARRLFETYAPGPLTIVLPRLGSGGVCDLVTAGLDTVGIRIPDHRVARALLNAFDGPIAAPSANVSNHVSPTTAAHVREAFGDRVFVLDGGPSAVGVESTVLDLASDRPRLWRPGAVTQAQIEAVIGQIDRFVGHVSPTVAATSPGQQAKHYAPRAPAFRFSQGDAMPRFSGRAYAIVFERLPAAWDRAAFADVRRLGDAADATRNFYATLREIDAFRPDAIFVELPKNALEWTALSDRITRATE